MNDQAYERIEDARLILGFLGLDAERSNERSAQVLLALLHLTPTTPWPDAEAPMLGTRAIMDWIRDEYGTDYAPNTRETIRRFTLHQFVDATLAIENPDQPDRPVNSPKWRYQISDHALHLIRAYQTDAFHPLLVDYLRDAQDWQRATTPNDKCSVSPSLCPMAALSHSAQAVRTR